MTTRPVMLAGDWNAPPRDRDRYRPRWLARKAKLAIHSPGRGAMGEVDYPITDAQVERVRRVDKMGSDHQPVLFTVRHGGKLLRGGCWNVLHRRDPELVAMEVAQLFHVAALDFLAVQEGTGYHKPIAAIGLVVVGDNSDPSKASNYVVVRPGLPHTGPRVQRLSRRGWPLGPGGKWHLPIYAVSTRVAWLRVVSCHLPNHERGYWHNLAYRQGARRLRRYVVRRRRHLASVHTPATRSPGTI